MIIGLGIGIPFIHNYANLQVTPSFDPAEYFSNGEQGFIYDISDLSTLFQDTAGTVPVTAAGQSVARINDKSGNGNHATQTTATSRAVLVSFNGKYWIQPDGIDDWYITPTITPGTDKVQVFAGARKLGAAPGMIAEFSPDLNSNRGSLYLLANTGTNAGNVQFVVNGLTGDAIVGTVSFPENENFVASANCSIVPSQLEFEVNGVAGTNVIPTGITGSFQTYQLYLFRRGGVKLPFNGMISSMVWRFGPNLTPEQIANMNAWTNDRAGAY